MSRKPTVAALSGFRFSKRKEPGKKICVGVMSLGRSPKALATGLVAPSVADERKGLLLGWRWRRPKRNPRGSHDRA
jgi:hypothetical protein